LATFDGPQISLLHELVLYVPAALVLFLISWATFIGFTHNLGKSAAAGAKIAGVYYGLLVVTTVVVVWSKQLSVFGPVSRVLFLAGLLVVTVGGSYLHLASIRKGVLAGLIISVAFLTAFFLLIPVIDWILEGL
jgi:hypothetical protein